MSRETPALVFAGFDDEPLLSAEEAEAVDAARAALRCVEILLPHLGEMARLVRLVPDARIGTIAVFASGRIVINPGWMLGIAAPDRVFVLAHDLLHLVLGSHDRCGGFSAKLNNAAEDYVINDLLRETLNRDVPEGGLDCPGIASLSVERIAAELRLRMLKGEALPTAAWDGASGPGELPEGAPIDVLDTLVERLWFPGDGSASRHAVTETITAAANRAVALGVWRDRLDKFFYAPEAADSAAETVLLQKLDQQFPDSWQAALQRWLEEAAPVSRGYARRSRRQGDRDDIVMRGRRPAGWTLDLVLDTTGSGEEILTALQAACSSAGIESVRIRRCGATASDPEVVAVDDVEAALFRSSRGDVRPVLQRLGADPMVEAVVVITEGDDDHDTVPTAYPTLWAHTGPLSG